MAPWRRARHAWQRLRGTATAPPPPDVATLPPEPFERLLDDVAAHGDAWFSDERAVVLPVAPAPPVAVVTSAWRYLVVRGLAADTASAVAAFAWSPTGDAPARRRVHWAVPGDGTPRTFVIDLAAATWACDPQATDVRLEAPGMRAGQVALVADLVQLDASDARWSLARRYVHGSGIECGALQYPLRVPDDARVRYVDRLTTAQARAHYPELGDAPLTSPDVVGDVHRLPIADASVDFYVGNHLLEHARDAIASLEEMLRVVRPGGIVYVSVPDVRNPLDRHRPVTPLQHHLDDHDPALDRRAAHDAHYREYVESAHAHLDARVRDDLVARFLAQDYSIHFHTFDQRSLRELLRVVCSRAGARLVEMAQNVSGGIEEHIAVLRRTS